MLWWMFFIPCDNWKRSLSIKFYRYFFFFNRHVVTFLFWKEPMFYTLLSQEQHNSYVKVSRYSYVMVQYYTSSIFLTNFIIWLLLLNSFPLRFFLFCFINEIFFVNKRNPKPLWKHVFIHGSNIFDYLQIFYEVRTKLQISKIIIPIIIIIMVNLSLINNKNVITSNSKHRTNSKYSEQRRRKN